MDEHILGGNTHCQHCVQVKGSKIGSNALFCFFYLYAMLAVGITTKYGLTITRHNDIRDITANWLSEVCRNVEREPPPPPRPQLPLYAQQHRVSEGYGNQRFLIRGILSGQAWSKDQRIKGGRPTCHNRLTGSVPRPKMNSLWWRPS